MSNSDLFEFQDEYKNETFNMQKHFQKKGRDMLPSNQAEVNDDFDSKIDIVEEFDYNEESLALLKSEDEFIFKEKPSPDLFKSCYSDYTKEESAMPNEKIDSELNFDDFSKSISMEVEEVKINSESTFDDFTKSNSLEVEEELNFKENNLTHSETELHILHSSDDESNCDEFIEDFEWPKGDIDLLISHIEQNLPKNDHCSFNKRSLKLDWNKIAFGHYTPDECKEMWLKIQAIMRKKKTLSEALSDAKRVLKKGPVLTYKIYDSKPSRPKSAFLLFQKDVEDNIREEHPGIHLKELIKIIRSKYNELPQTEKEKYINLAAQLRLEYKSKQKEFYSKHPECPRNRKELKTKKEVSKLDCSARKPQTPFGLYLDAQLKKVNLNNEEKKLKFIKQCKKDWAEMEDEAKLFWINWSEQQYVLHKKEHPINCKISLTDVLNKAERKILKQHRKISPPDARNGFEVFRERMLKSKEMKKLNLTSPDNLYFLSLQWSYLNEKEKAEFRYFAGNLKKDFKAEFDDYLNSLPEHQKFSEHHKTQVRWTKKKVPKTEEKVFQVDQIETSKRKASKLKEPVPPESSLEEYYKNITKKKKASVAWTKLTQEEKQKHESNWLKKKNSYIIEYEKFLNSLSKEELQEYTRRLKGTRHEKVSISDASESDDSSEDR